MTETYSAAFDWARRQVDTGALPTAVLGIADRMLVMHEGAITGELARDQLNEEAVMQLATGNKAAA